jgi:nucleotide-binding universal stress UspA family protein
MLTRIIAAVDGEPGGRDAAALANALAAQTDADLLLAAVYPEPLLPFPLSLGRDGPRLGDEANRMLQDARREHAPQSRTCAIPDISAARALRHLAEREHADLLVLGSSHRAPEHHARGGRTARQTLHDAPCAVAIAASGLAQTPRLARIVTGYDGSPESSAALQLAAQIATRAGATLEAIAVADETLPPMVAPVGAAGVLTHWDEIVELKRQRAQRLAREAETACAACDGATGTHRVGDPAVELANAAQGADLLVLGSRHWGRLERIALGSTGEELLHEAPCSLLFVPRPAEVETSVEEARNAVGATTGDAAV